MTNRARILWNCGDGILILLNLFILIANYNLRSTGAIGGLWIAYFQMFGIGLLVSNIVYRNFSI